MKKFEEERCTVEKNLWDEQNWETDFAHHTEVFLPEILYLFYSAF